jgi:hypothetical protein
MLVAAQGLLTLLAVGALGWAVVALHYTAPGSRVVRDGWAALALVAPLVVGFALDSFWSAIGAAAMVAALVAVWFRSLKPPQVADWQPSVAELPRATLNGDELTISNLRNFDYRSETDFTPRWETRRYDLSRLVGLDMFFSHWAGPAIAHTIMSWSFADGRQLAISIETRNRRGQPYSAIAGFFRQFPIYYVVADERDVIRLRTNYRGEHVWLYRLQAPDGVAHALLLDYLDSVNRLADRPAWYNALTDNCTTTIRRHVRRLNPGANPWTWRLLANGYLPQLLYEQGRLDASRPFSELHAISNIDARAKAATYEDFSAAIRDSLPNPRVRH